MDIWAINFKDEMMEQIDKKKDHIESQFLVVISTDDELWKKQKLFKKLETLNFRTSRETMTIT